MRRKKYQQNRQQFEVCFKPRVTTLAVLALLLGLVPAVTALHQGGRLHQRTFDQMLESETAAAYELSDMDQQQQQASLSQETIEAAASQATEEAVAEAQGDMLRMTTEAELDNTSLLGQSSMLHSLEAADAGALDMLASQSVLEAESGSAVDSTLEEIKKLRIIDSELAKRSGSEDSESAQAGDKIDEKQIEATAMEQLGGAKDRPAIESLVQQQVQDQVDKIDSRNTLIENFDTLEYGANIDNKAFLQADDDDTSAIIQIKVLQPKPAPKVVKTKPAPQPEADAAITQSQAALDAVQIKPVGGKAHDASKGPLMPSADASKDSLDATFSYQAKPKANIYKQKKRPDPAQERQMLDQLIEKSVQLGRQKAEQVPKPQKPAFVEPPKVSKEEQALALISAKQVSAPVVIQEAPEKPQRHQHVTKKHHRQHKHHHHNHELVQVKEKEGAQLDNLFQTMKDDLLAEKDRILSERHSQKPKQHSLVQISAHGKLQSKGKARQADVTDLSLDEQADLMLKSKAHQMTQSVGSADKTAPAKNGDTQDSTPKDTALVGHSTAASDSHDTILKTLMEDEETDQAVAAAAHGPDDCATAAAANDVEMSGADALKLFSEAADDADKHAAKEAEKPKKPEAQVDDRLATNADELTLKLLEEHANERAVEKAESTDEDKECPESSPLEDDTFLQLGAEMKAQVAATVAARAEAASMAAAASQAMTQMGVEQQAHVAAQDQGMIDTLKAAIAQMEHKKNPALAVADAKKKAVNNIQKALTKKILTRLDDTQPLVNVFSKMQSLSKMMPAIQDFERRLNILHQVEPILESAISTLSKVVDLSAPVPAMPASAHVPKPAPPPAPAPAPAAPAGPDLSQLQALLATAQGQQAAAAPAPAAPAAEPDAEDGSGGLDLSALLGGAAAPAPAAAPAAPAGLEALLGAAAEPEQPAMETPAFLAAPAAAPAAEAADGGGAGAVESEMISRLLGGAL